MHLSTPLPGRHARRKGSGPAGYAVGLMHIAAPFPVVPGNPVNASTFDFPVLYEEVVGLTGAEVIAGDPSGAKKLADAARRLEAAGVCAVAGACGSFANFQTALSEAVEIPVFASVLTLAPVVLASLPKGKALGVVFADANAFTARVRRECAIRDDAPIRVTDVCDHPGFAALIAGASEFDEADFADYFERRLIGFLKSHPEIGAVMIQCNELIPYAWTIQKHADLPVFDAAGLVRWVHGACAHRPPSGLAFGLGGEA